MAMVGAGDTVTVNVAERGVTQVAVPLTLPVRVQAVMVCCRVVAAPLAAVVTASSSVKLCWFWVV